MPYLLVVMLLTSVMELAVTGWKPNYRRMAAKLLGLIELVVIVGLLAGYGYLMWVDALGFVSLYRLVNLYRLGYGASNEQYLRHVTRQTSWHLLVFQALVSLVGLAFTVFNRAGLSQWLALAAAQLILALLLLISTLRHMSVSNRLVANEPLTDAEAPTLSVAIPARNETDNLYDCLVSLLASDYPKLEILVLDDNSTIKRTPEIIRSFAHDGVEFVAGKELPKSGWLAKNWAYEQLLEVANGDLILFCGADTRFQKDSLKNLVSILMKRQKSMLSIVPRNQINSGAEAGVLQPMRYAWEISLPRRWFKRPPVLSTCWLAKKEFLRASGGFKAVSRRVVCESYFAREAIKHDGYSFFRFDSISSLKPADEQLETAIRLRYPQLKRQPEFVALLSVIELFAILGSLASVLWGLSNANYPVAGLGFVSVVVTAVMFAQIYDITYRTKSWLAYCLWPVGFLTDIYIMHISMWRYEFGSVLWKGRSVTPSVMYSDKA